jgi:hypothetical protein
MHPTFYGKGSIERGPFDIFGNGIPDFLIAFYSNCVDSVHGFFTNRRNALEIPGFHWFPVLHVKIPPKYEIIIIKKY